jgi:hypothetical protein
MMNTHCFLPSPLPEAGLTPLATPPISPSHRKRLRLYLVGSEADAESAISYLHVRGCIDRIEWSHAIAVPENGIIIRHDPGDVLRYLQREGHRPGLEGQRQFG